MSDPLGDDQLPRASWPHYATARSLCSPCFARIARARQQVTLDRELVSPAAMARCFTACQVFLAIALPPFATSFNSRPVPFVTTNTARYPSGWMY